MIVRRQLNRSHPRLPVQAMRTYQLSAPIQTHRRRATCEEAGCLDYHHGWRVRVEGLTEADLHLAKHCGRRWRELSVAAAETWLIFEAGQPCFRSATHTVPLEREALYIVRGGDWRGHVGTRRVHKNAADWVDDFATNQDRLLTRVNRAHG